MQNTISGNMKNKHFYHSSSHEKSLKMQRKRERDGTCWALTLSVIFFWGERDGDPFDAQEAEIVVEELTIVQTNAKYNKKRNK